MNSRNLTKKYCGEKNKLIRFLESGFVGVIKLIRFNLGMIITFVSKNSLRKTQRKILRTFSAFDLDFWMSVAHPFVIMPFQGFNRFKKNIFSETKS